MRYSSSLVTVILVDLSVLIIIISPSFFLFISFLIPSLIFWETLHFWLPCLSQFSFLYFLYVLVWKSLLDSMTASRSGGNGLGKVTRLHSLRSVTRRFLSSKTLFSGSYIWRALASISSAFLLIIKSSSVISISSSPSTFSSNSLFICILIFA